MTTPPPPPPRWQGYTGRGAVHMVDVRAHNQEEELARIRALARDYRIAAVAVLHDGPAAAAAGKPPDLEGCYAVVRASVERARSAQLCLALADRDGELAGVWRFHLGAAAAAAADGGLLADPRRVCEGIMAYGRATTRDSMLVTSDGAEDVAYLVRHITGGLPGRRHEFLEEAGACFPALYDIRVLAEWTHLDGSEPPFAGPSPSAFRRLVALAQDSGFWEVKTAYNAFLYGLGAADTDQLLSFKEFKPQRQEKLRRLHESLVQMYGEDYVGKDKLSNF
ncbi:hypothetical protein EJB05_47945, partial [Eragrostis curvula]